MTNVQCWVIDVWRTASPRQSPFLCIVSPTPCWGRLVFIRLTWLLYGPALLNGPKESCRSRFTSPHKMMHVMILLRYCKLRLEYFRNQAQ